MATRRSNTQQATIVADADGANVDIMAMFAEHAGTDATPKTEKVFLSSKIKQASAAMRTRLANIAPKGAVIPSAAVVERQTADYVVKNVATGMRALAEELIRQADALKPSDIAVAVSGKNNEGVRAKVYVAGNVPDVYSAANVSVALDSYIADALAPLLPKPSPKTAK